MATTGFIAGVDYSISDINCSGSTQVRSIIGSLAFRLCLGLTALDLYRERHDPDDLQERDCVDRALQDLVSAGLVHRNGPFVIPTRAALKFEELSSL